MSSMTAESKRTSAGVIAVCGNPNCGKTTIFNNITGLNQHVGNYSGVTVERITGQFSVSDNPKIKYNLVDVPGAYSLSAFTPDEYIAASALFGDLPGEPEPDVIIAVMDATNLERSFYFLLQVFQIGKPVVVAINMSDLADRRCIAINYGKLSRLLGGTPVLPIVGNKGHGIKELKETAVKLIGTKPVHPDLSFDPTTEQFIVALQEKFPEYVRTRAHALRIIFDYDGPAEQALIASEGEKAQVLINQERFKIKSALGALSIGEIQVLTNAANELYREVVSITTEKDITRSDKLDKFFLHPVLGPIVLVGLMMFVFQSIFSWAEPFMNVIDSVFGSLSAVVEGSMADGPLRSLITDGIIGGVGSVLIFIPQIVILFVFIALLEDSGYMPRAAFLVDRMFRWCGLSGKSFIPMLSSFACAVPGIMATRTIEDRKLRLITIMVAPLMTCSARLPVYAIMIAAFIPYKTFLGIFNLQGITLALLYLLGIVIAVAVSFIMNKLIYKTERGTFMMELPSYKVPTFKSVVIRVYNRVKSFVIRAGTVIMAITIVIWALSYYPRSASVLSEYEQKINTVEQQIGQLEQQFDNRVSGLTASLSPENQTLLDSIITPLQDVNEPETLRETTDALNASYPQFTPIISEYHAYKSEQLAFKNQTISLANQQAGAQIRDSYFGKIGRFIEPAFEPLGWDWKITMSVLASFPAREVIIAVLGTIYNLGTDVDEESSSLIDKMRSAKWESGDKIGQPVFSIAVALSIMVFFALCSQCGATLVTIKQETNSWLYPVIVFTYMTTLAYIVALIVYQLFRGI